MIEKKIIHDVFLKCLLDQNEKEDFKNRLIHIEILKFKSVVYIPIYTTFHRKMENFALKKWFFSNKMEYSYTD